ncbi:MAG: FHA domain-containing protein, partial [Rhizobacter sp.]
RDGQIRQSHSVAQWPLRVGRALDNDLVLSDPHVAAHHLHIAETEAGLALHVDETRNGVQLGNKRLPQGESALLPTHGKPIELMAGSTRLRLRLPGHEVAPEVVIAPAVSLKRRAAPLLLAGFLLLAGLLFNNYLNSDPDGLNRAIGNTLVSAFVGGAVWCGFWATLSKIFTRQTYFFWHLRVFLVAGIALMLIDIVPAMLAFMFSWPWMTDFAFVGEIAVAAAALYFHLLAVEPARHRLLKWVAAVCAVVGIGLTLWFNVQRSDMLGDELYMNHLFPPALRLAKPVSADAFV